MPSRTPRHRHLVAVPLFALVFAGSLPVTWSALPSLRAQALTAEENAVPAEEGTLLSDGTAALVLDGDGLALQDGWPVLPDGSVLVAAQGIVRLAAGEIELIGWNGAFQATAEEGTLTVAAITTPVLVRADGERMVVPAGMRWTVPGNAASLSGGFGPWLEDRTPVPLPADVLRDAVTLARSLRPADLATPASDAPFIASPVPDLLRLPASRVRGQEERAVLRVALLRDMIATGPVEEARALLVSPDTAAMFGATANGMRALPGLLHAALEKETLVAALLPYAAADVDLWMLLSFHPSVQALTWMQAAPETASAEDALLRLLLLPQSDLLPQSAAPSTYVRWSAELTETLEVEEEPATTLRSMLPVFSTSVRRARTAGYVERAGLMADGIAEAADRLDDELPEDLRVALRALRKPVETSPEDAVIETLSAEEAAQLQAKAAQLLAEIGARENADTRYRAVDGHTVDVTGILVGVRAFSFTFDLKRDELTSISSNGTTYPFPSHRTRFTAWAEKLE